jgi:hypothetical protein
MSTVESSRDLETSQPTHELVGLVLPSDSKFIVVARMAAAAMGSRSGFDVAAIEDLKLAVDEGLSLAIEMSETGGAVSLDLQPVPAGLRIAIRTPSESSPDVEGYPWAVLKALTQEASYGKGSISFIVSGTREDPTEDL